MTKIWLKFLEKFKYVVKKSDYKIIKAGSVRFDNTNGLLIFSSFLGGILYFLGSSYKMTINTAQNTLIHFTLNDILLLY